MRAVCKVILNDEQWAEVLQCLWWQTVSSQSSHLAAIAHSVQEQVERQQEASLIDLDPREVELRRWDGEREVPAL
jgi:hypothetical protein